MTRNMANVTRSMNCCVDLPLDLLPELLARLPTKTLLRFMCVCKEWRSLINSTDFASLHLTLYNNNPRNDRLFLIERSTCNYRNPKCSIRRSGTFAETGDLALPNDLGRLHPEGYTSGLVLFRKFNDNEGTLSGFIIWNPSIRKSIHIPLPSSVCNQNRRIHVRVVRINIAGVENGHDYKVVVMPVCQIVESYALVEVYSLSTGSWMSFSVRTQCLWDLSFSSKTPYLNGALHWVGCHATPRVPRLGLPSYVVALDVQNEVLNHFGLPVDDTVFYHLATSLAILGESLALLDSRGQFLDIFVMEQYGAADSWIKRFKIRLEFLERLSYLARNGEVLLTREAQGLKMRTYDLNSGNIRYVTESYWNRKLNFMDTFTESLVLLQSDNNSKKCYDFKEQGNIHVIGM